MSKVIINRKDKKRTYEKKISSLKTKGLDAKKYCGSILLKKDPLEIQRELRGEWQ